MGNVPTLDLVPLPIPRVNTACSHWHDRLLSNFVGIAPELVLCDVLLISFESHDTLRGCHPLFFAQMRH